MDFMIAMLIEFGCMVTITRQNTCEDVVMNYVALQCICEIKRVFYAVNDSPLKKEFEKNDRQIFYQQGEMKYPTLYRTLKTIVKKVFVGYYELVYFYITPYLIFMIIYASHVNV